MIRSMLCAVALTLLVVPAALAQGGGRNALDELKEILKQMRLAEELLAKVSLERGSKAEKEAIERIKKIENELAPTKPDEAAKVQDEVVRRLSHQMEVVRKHLDSIVKGIDVIIQKARMGKGQSPSQMETGKKKPGKKGKENQKKMSEAERLKKMRDKGGKGGPKEGESKNTQAERPYDPKKKNPSGAAPRKATGAGRWGALPPKFFRDILHPADFPKPQKYEDLINSYFEMLSKKAKK